MATRVVVDWQRQARQVQFLEACGLAFAIKGEGQPERPIADTILYGGAAGGGKSDALLMVAFIICVIFRGAKVAFFRRKFTQLEGPGGAIMRSTEMWGGLGVAKWNGQMHRWTFKNGSVIQFCHCQFEKDLQNYQSQQFDVILFDEATQFTRHQVHYMFSRNRTVVPGLVPFIALATNPGNVGHGWVKKEFIDQGRLVPGEPFQHEVEEGVWRTHAFIPARLDDNQVLVSRDPGYRNRLMSLDPMLRKQLLEGDWDSFTGQFFPEFDRALHVVQPFAIPRNWIRAASLDWGYVDPCCILWHAVNPQTSRIVTYREEYFSEKRASDAAEYFLSRSVHPDGAREHIAYVRASPDMFRETGLGGKTLPGPTIAESWIEKGIPLQPADNRRIIGWTRMREFLKQGPDGVPYWQIFSTCENLVRTLPELVRDDSKPEDVDPECEDHPGESARYYLMSRPQPSQSQGFLPGNRGKRRLYGPRGEVLVDDEDDDDEESIRQTGGFYR